MVRVLTYRAISSLLSNDRVCVSLARQSFWVATSQPSTHAKTSSSRPSSCLETFPTLLNSLQRLAHRPSTAVSTIEFYFQWGRTQLISTTAYEWNETILPNLKLRQQVLLSSPETLAVDAAHASAFHRGLGESAFATSATPFESYFSEEGITEFAQSAYAKPNISLVSVGPNSAEVSKWVSQFFAEHPASAAAGQFKVKETVPSKYFGGEQRTPSKAGNAVVIGFPGSAQFGASGYKAEVDVLAALLGGESSIKWTPGFSLLAKAVEGETGARVSTKNFAYSDAGLFAITVTGKADAVNTVAKKAAEAVKQVAAGQVPADDIKKAIALAKFRALEAAQIAETGIELTGSALIGGSKPYQISEIASSFETVTPQKVQEVSYPFL
jgi:ubiquinol-cytochrome c reductase core subunit 2